ncbi:ribonuclease H-like domain-containing protein [Tanacetum coccineum]
MTTAGKRAVFNTGKGKMDIDLKKSRWVWRPKGNYLDHLSKDNGSFMLKKIEYGNPEILLQDHAVVDSGCSSHMTGNKAYLSDYEDYNGGFVAFGSDPKGGKITGKGKIRTANLEFDDVYFVDKLKFNLFSVSQMCDKKNSVLFTETKCLILSPSFKLLDESQVVLRAPRKDDVYSLDLKNIVPSGGITCLYANATADESKLWHRRLGHVNFKNINKLVKGHLVRGNLQKFSWNDHTCVADARSISNIRPPNGVHKRKNKNPNTATRTMLADSLLPIPFWAEAVNTACYVLNKVHQERKEPTHNTISLLPHTLLGIKESSRRLMMQQDKLLKKKKDRMLQSQKRAAQATSINKISTIRSSVSTATTPYVSAVSTPTGANAGESSFDYS